jgi:alkanesulfonate monooxygenase SsuD/methylene tetrahydromethanopterin reductase-like flavin-dependent oxidoreductase (luciferase family)
MVLLESDPAKARAAARTALSTYIQLDNYANNWRRLGFTEDDLAGGGSNRFVDANIAWGDEGAIRKRLQLFWDAGADHVCIQSIHPSGSRTTIDERIFDRLSREGSDGYPQCTRSKRRSGRLLERPCWPSLD